MGPICQACSYFAAIGYNMPMLGFKKFEFGSCVITSVGSLGVEDSFAPIPALTFAPLLLTMCKSFSKRKKGENGEIVENKYVQMNFTADYRYFEPSTAALLIKEVNKYL